MTQAPYCGEMRVRPGQFLRRDPAGGVEGLFQGRRAGYSFLSRVAIRKAVDLLGLLPGDEVLAPAYNCGSELEPLLKAGLTVRLFPVAGDTAIDPAEVERRIGPATRAVYLIHYFGQTHPASAALRALCDGHGLALIEDSALNLLSGGAAERGRWGDVATFCLHKFFPLQGGGVLVVNSNRITGDPDFPRAAPASAVRRHLIRAGLLGLPGVAPLLQARRGKRQGAQRGGAGATPDGTELPDMPASYYFDPALAGTAISPWDKQALGSFDIAAAVRARRAHYRDYLDRLAELRGVAALFPDLPAETCPLTMPVLVEDRDRLAQALIAQGIAATPWWAGYDRNLDFSDGGGAAYLKDHILSLPVHQDLGAGAPGRVVAALAKALRG